MKFEEIVSIYNKKKGKCKSYLLELQELKELGSLPHTGESDGMPTSKNNGSSVENYVMRIDEIERKLKQLDIDLITVRGYIMNFIDHIDDYYIKRIVELYTFRNSRYPDWYKIARDVGYSEKHAKRLYEDGINRIKNIELAIIIEND